MLQKTALWALVGITFLVVAMYIAFQISQWPSVLYHRHHGRIRQIIDHSWFGLQRALERYAVTARLNERFDTNDPDAVLDVHYPSEVANTDRKLPTIIWVHGGGFTSGSKDGVAHYLTILAAKNYTVVGVNYSLAPGKIYPTPILQVNAALTFLGKNAAGLHVDASKLFLAGNSAGAQIAAQLAAVITNSPYAKQMGVTPSIDRHQLKGVILHCGLYDLRDGGEIRAAIARSYLGTKDFTNDPRLEEFFVAGNMTADFPPMFISVGNADRLESQSQQLADTATKLGVSVDSLFFPVGYTPPLPHGYQFNLDSDAGRLALERTIRFLAGRSQ